MGAVFNTDNVTILSDTSFHIMIYNYRMRCYLSSAIEAHLWEQQRELHSHLSVPFCECFVPPVVLRVGNPWQPVHSRHRYCLQVDSDYLLQSHWDDQFGHKGIANLTPTCYALGLSANSQGLKIVYTRGWVVLYCDMTLHGISLIHYKLI